MGGVPIPRRRTGRGWPGLWHILNVVPSTHPEPLKIKGWLGKRGFGGGHDHQQLRRVVSSG